MTHVDSCPSGRRNASHYFGQLPGITDHEVKVQLFHRTENASYPLIELSINVESPHRGRRRREHWRSDSGQTGRDNRG